LIHGLPTHARELQEQQQELLEEEIPFLPLPAKVDHDA